MSAKVLSGSEMFGYVMFWSGMPKNQQSITWIDGKQDRWHRMIQLNHIQVMYDYQLDAGYRCMTFAKANYSFIYEWWAWLPKYLPWGGEVYKS